ncbi:TetR/AcrR family transcriptional regulator [Streptomyces phaeochromogenes]
MNDTIGLREHKKDATRRLLMRIALGLFEERGFASVSVAQVAAAAQVSKKTVFNYFACKEDLILSAGRQHIAEPAAVVRERAPGQTPHSALRAYLLTALAERRPMTGLSGRTDPLRLARLIAATPALAARRLEYDRQSQDLLAEVLAEEHSSEITARLVAAQLLSVQQVLFAENWRRVTAGESPDDVYPDAVRATEHAFQLLEHGLGDLFRRLGTRTNGQASSPGRLL